MTVIHMQGKSGSSERKGVLAALDIGSSKISCIIAETIPARHKTAAGADRHTLKILGFGHHLSRGVKGGAIVDVEQAERTIRVVVDAAERMAQRSISQVYINVSGGRPQSECFKGAMTSATGTISPRDVDKVVSSALAQINPRGRTVMHLAPIQYQLDAAQGITSPLGLHGQELQVELGVVTAETAHLRNLALVVERAHLSVQGYVIAPYAAGRAVLADDEMQLGTILLEMGGATTGISIFHNGSLIFADSIPIGGMHVTNDIARGLSTTVAHAERMKTLWGNTMASAQDEIDMLAVPLLGERGVDTVQQVPRAVLTSIIRPRLDEIFEHVKKRLENCAVAHLGGQRVVLSGGASQLTGVREVATHWLGRQVRLASLTPIAGMPEAVKSPSFAVSLGLLNYGLRPDKACAMPEQAAATLTEAQYGYVRRVGRWIADSF